MTNKSLDITERIDILEQKVKELEQQLLDTSLALECNSANNLMTIVVFLKALMKENNLSREKTLSLIPYNCPDKMREILIYYFDL